MPKYRVKPGRSHSGFKVVDGKRVRHTYGSGEEIELTENSAMAFSDCFDLVEESKSRAEMTPVEKAAATRAKNKAAKEEAAKAAESGG